jgi:hypothetical protein
MAETIEDLILRLTEARGAEKSICPSEVARELGDTPGVNWQRHMTPVRQAAIRLTRLGKIEVLRKGKPVADLNDVKGVIRLRIAAKQSET